jgi:hypothetical protein
MIVAFDKAFHKRLIKIKDKNILQKVKEIIIQTESRLIFSIYRTLKKLKGTKHFIEFGLVIIG